MANNDVQIIVVGAGHAGIEAGLACARMGLQTLLITTNLDRIGYMSCNPAIGGLAKGHMVRELGVLGGEMARATDASCIQFKRLNESKGPAVRGSRAQCDKDLYVKYMTYAVMNQENLKVLSGEVKSLKIEDSICRGIYLGDGSFIRSQKVIITTGTFMNAVMHVGNAQESGGRVGDKATTGLSDQLKSLGLQVQRLKTGTPPRIFKESIDFSKTTPQPGDEKFYPFSFLSKKEYGLPQIECYLSYTNEQTHELIEKNLHKSPLYSGIIEGVGPRYCPSIEDKIVRFKDRIRHQTFFEPEGLSTNLVYLQGVSTSLPVEAQELFIRTIPGLENAKFARHGYAVEYDFILPTQIRHTLEVRGISNLYLAGQVNGTSGYEEAAAQGFVAGVNAAMSLLDQDPLVFGRDQAYIGVLIDDLVTKGTLEPYRMFTSRAEHRLLLREDNTLERLIDASGRIGLVSEEGLLWAQKNQELKLRKKQELSETKIVPNKETNDKLIGIESKPLLKPVSLEQLLRRPEIGMSHLGLFGFDPDLPPEVSEQIEIDVKYSGYIKKQKELVAQTARLEGFRLEESLDYSQIKGLSLEEVEKLSRVKPINLGQARRISGVNPSAIQSILIYLKGKRKIGQLEA